MEGLEDHFGIAFPRSGMRRVLILTYLVGTML